MSPAEDGRIAPQDDAIDQVCHDLKSPLTTISGRAQLVARQVRRSPSLAEDERTTMLRGLGLIIEAVTVMVERIDRLRAEQRAARMAAGDQPDKAR